MEGIDWKITETHKEPKGSGTSGAVDTAGTGVESKRHINIYENSTRHNRLEWRC